MDYQLLLLIAMVAATVVVGIKSSFWWRPSRPGNEYQRLFNITAAGLLYLVAGLIGWDLRYSRGWFQGARWVNGPVWWQVGAGTVLLVLAGFWARRLMPGPARK